MSLSQCQCDLPMLEISTYFSLKIAGANELSKPDAMLPHSSRLARDCMPLRTVVLLFKAVKESKRT